MVCIHQSERLPAVRLFPQRIPGHGRQQRGQHRHRLCEHKQRRPAEPAHLSRLRCGRAAADSQRLRDERAAQGQLLLDGQLQRRNRLCGYLLRHRAHLKPAHRRSQHAQYPHHHRGHRDCADGQQRQIEPARAGICQRGHPGALQQRHRRDCAAKGRCLVLRGGQGAKGLYDVQVP